MPKMSKLPKVPKIKVFYQFENHIKAFPSSLRTFAPPSLPAFQPPGNMLSAGKCLTQEGALDSNRKSTPSLLLQIIGGALYSDLVLRNRNTIFDQTDPYILIKSLKE